MTETLPSAGGGLPGHQSSPVQESELMQQELGYNPPLYPKRVPDQSARYCNRHQVLQERFIRVEGPFDDYDCRLVIIKQPRNSHWFIWKLILLGWLVSPVSDRWYVIKESAKCPQCIREQLMNYGPQRSEEHHEKKYRRVYGRLGLLILKIKVYWWPDYYSFTAK